MNAPHRTAYTDLPPSRMQQCAALFSALMCLLCVLAYCSALLAHRYHCAVVDAVEVLVNVYCVLLNLHVTGWPFFRNDVS